ncbi:hypothetical protein [Paenibacillus rigui]|uniref:DUF4352 domain-containing protein n=1 Tax=Paenibacillus rigui TaxID=554312 RepID=A0A229ULQ1_9BACL|nr:hypothetical protein [Paenibacillus rigui]OXM84224.1 hypothetical protein CF651_20780 [Paenibacillus rigui]
MLKFNQSKQTFRAKKTTWLCALAVCTTLLANAPLASAGKPGVFIANDTYFTLENASYLSGADSSALQFSLKMHNGSSGSIDFNGYGVQIIDEQGNSFPAKLTSQQNARVNPGQEQQFSFVSQMAAHMNPQNLKVHLFSWDSSAPTFMRGIGDLEVSSAVSNGGLNPAQAMLISMRDIDSSYSPEALAAMRIGNSYKVTENGTQYLYTDLYVRNAGSSNFQLPSGLQFRLKGSDLLTYSSSIMNAAQETLLPNKLKKIKIRTTVPASLDAESTSLEAFYTESSIDHVLGSVPLAGMANAAAIGTEQPYALYGTDNGLKLKVEQATAVKQTEGMMLQTTVILRNDGSEVVALPTLTASYQLGSESLAAAVQDKSTDSAFLTPNQSVTYHYAVSIPDGVDPGTVKLALYEAVTPSGSSSSTSNTSSSTTTGSTSSSSTSGSSSTGSSSTTSGTSSSTTSSSSSSTKSGTTVSSSSLPVLLIDLKGTQQAGSSAVQARPYQLGDKLILSPNGLIDKNLDLSLVELHMHENEDFGYKTAIAKYKITNTGSSTLTIPDIGTELVNDSGMSFTGVKQSSTVTTIMPNTSYVVSYSYQVPTDTKNWQNLALNIIDPKTAAPNKLSIGTFQVAVQNEAIDNIISFYPFQVTFNSYAIQSMYSSGYIYQLSLDLTIEHKDTVIIDQNFSKMEFELVDGLGRTIGSKSLTFTGTDKLITGNQKITFSDIKTEQFDNNLVINVYETIETPYGTAKRLVKQLKE